MCSTVQAPCAVAEVSRSYVTVRFVAPGAYATLVAVSHCATVIYVVYNSA